MSVARMGWFVDPHRTYSVTLTTGLRTSTAEHRHSPPTTVPSPSARTNRTSSVDRNW